MRLFEWTYKDFSKYQETLPEFVSYLSQVWQSRIKYDVIEEDLSEEEIEERKIAKQRFFDFSYDHKISARNYVGVVQFENIRLEVYPKIFASQKDLDWKQLQLNILFWLSYCRKIKFPFSIVDVSSIDFDDFLEVLIFIFSNYTFEILSAQPYQSYQEITENVSFLKGRLSFPDYINNNLVTGKWQNFHCTHEPFIFDNQFNRIVKFITNMLLSISASSFNKRKLNDILFLLDEVTDFKCTVSDCDKVKLNPLYSDLENILSLCRLFLSNAVVDIQNEDSKNFCFLIPMEYIFEDFTVGFLIEHFPKINIISQANAWLATRNGRNVFQIKNDILINHSLIIDTKYKVRASTDGLKGGIIQTDIYQMLAYALRRNSKQVILIYPNCKNGNNEELEFAVPIESDVIPIVIFIKSVDITFEATENPVIKIKTQFANTNHIFDLG